MEIKPQVVKVEKGEVTPETEKQREARRELSKRLVREAILPPTAMRRHVAKLEAENEKNLKKK